MKSFNIPRKYKPNPNSWENADKQTYFRPLTEASTCGGSGRVAAFITAGCVLGTFQMQYLMVKLQGGHYCPILEVRKKKLRKANT